MLLTDKRVVKGLYGLSPTPFHGLLSTLSMLIREGGGSPW